MKCGTEELKLWQPNDQAVFFDENVDIHHMFPQDGYKSFGIGSEIYSKIVNNTPIASNTNRIVGGGVPSFYLAD